jgi:multiple sugar transport system substrate-binding protein
MMPHLLPALLCVLVGCRRGGDRETVLRVADWGGPAGDPAFLRVDREIRSEFERRHPGVRVQVENIPGPGQYVPKLLMTFVAGNPPDVITLDAASAAAFIDHDLLGDLNPLVRGDPEFDLDNYFTNVVRIAGRDGCLYAVPLDFTPMVVLYNRRAFDAAGVAYPTPGWTREQFLATALALTRAQPDGSAPVRHGITFSPQMPIWLPWIWAG